MSKELERHLKALANRRRIAMLRYLKRRRQASVTEIAGAIKLSFKATSKHLRLLATTDILEHEQKSLQRFYSFAATLPFIVRALLSRL